MSIKVRDVVEPNPWTGLDAHPLPSADTPALQFLAAQAGDSAADESEPIGVDALKMRSHNGGFLSAQERADYHRSTADNAVATDRAAADDGEDLTDAVSILKRRSQSRGGYLPGERGAR